MSTTDHERARAGVPEPVRDGSGATDPGPQNLARDRQNPDLSRPPETDAGTVFNMRFSYSDTHRRMEPGGWSREITTRELPVATTLAGVNMRLTEGGIRELHWHKEAEWAIMLDGRARITALDVDGRAFVDDVGVGDLWNFPSGIPHSIQGLQGGCEFLLVFDDGGFSENSTFSITEWFAMTPIDVLAKNFGIDPDALAHRPTGQAYMLQGELPEPVRPRREAGFSHRLLEQEPIRTAGGQVRIVDSSNFPAASTVAAALVDVEPGALRELHWHPNTDEWQYYMAGEGRMTVFASGGRARTVDVREGDVGYVPFAMGHYVENTGSETLRFLEVFRSDHFADLSLEQWMALTPRPLLRSHLPVGDPLFDALHADKRPVVTNHPQAG